MIFRGSFSALAFAILVIAAAWSAHRFYLAPMKDRSAAVAAEIAALKVKIQDTRTRIKDVQDLEKASRATGVELAKLHSKIPDGSVLAWFPQRSSEHFARFKVPDVKTRLNSLRDDPKLAGYTRSYWAAEMPLTPDTPAMRKVLLAILEFESAEPFLKVLDVAIAPDSSDPQRHLAIANFGYLTPHQPKRNH